MRMTKVQVSWLGFAAVVLAIAFIGAAAIARTEFIDYKNQKAAQLEQTAVSEDTEAFDAAENACAEVPLAQKVLCFKELREARIAELRAQADLAAQQEMAVWSFGVLLVSLFGLLFSAGGFAALVWTFHETRRMTQAQDRAYLVVGVARIFQDPTYGLIYGLEVQNSGNTPATFVTASLELSFIFPDQSDRTNACVEKYAIRAALNEVPAKAVGHLNSGHLGKALSVPEGLVRSKGTHYRKTGTVIGTDEPNEDGVDPRIEVVGTVTYFDVFGGQHVLQVRQYSMSLYDDEWTLRNDSAFVNFVS